jgi:hypothetical protein
LETRCAGKQQFAIRRTDVLDISLKTGLPGTERF